MIYIGIDPDVQKSGVAVWYKSAQQLDMMRLPFFQLYDYLKNSKVGISQVIIEAGWLNKISNFHRRPGQAKSAGERIAKNVGANHETGKKIVEMCEHLQIPVKLIKPTKAKVSPHYFRSITGIDEKNQEKIDAAMLVYGI